MKCFIKPSPYKCNSCMEMQRLYNTKCDCNECQKETFELLQFTDHWAIVMDEKGDVHKKHPEEIRIIKEEGVNK